MARKKKVLVTPPGGAKSWLGLLPEPYASNPEVEVVMAPNGGEIQVRTYNGNTTLGVLCWHGRTHGLQVLHPSLSSREDHWDVFRAVGLRMAPVAYCGRLSDVPNKLLMDSRFPLVFLRDRLHEPFFNIRNAVASLTYIGGLRA